MKRILCALAALAILAVSAYGGLRLFHPPFLLVKEIRVSGIEGYDEAYLKESLSSLYDQSILSVDAGSVKRVVESFERVKEAKVKKDIFSRAVIVTVKERSPFCRIRLGGREFLVDEEGVLLVPRDDELASQLPIEVEAEKQYSSGQRLSEKRVMDALRAAVGLDEELKQLTASVLVSKSDIVLFHLDGYPIYFGGADDFKRKEAVLKALLDRLREQGKFVEYVDMSVSEFPVVKFKEGTGGGE